MTAPVYYSSGILGGNSNFTPAANASNGSIDVGTGTGRGLLVLAWCDGTSPVNTPTGITVGGVAMTAGPTNTSLSQPIASFSLDGSALAALTGTQTVTPTYTGIDRHPQLVWAVYSGGATSSMISNVAVGVVAASGGANSNIPAASATGATAVGLAIIDNITTGTDVGTTVQRSSTAYPLLTSQTGRVMDAPGAASVSLSRTYASSNSSAYLSASLAGTADTTPPTLTSPTGTGGVLVCSGSVSTNEAGGTLYTVVCASAVAPTAAQVKAGLDNGNVAALRFVSQAVTATGTQTIASGAVTAGTRYMYFAHEDPAANISAVASTTSFVVTAPAGPTFSGPIPAQTGTAGTAQSTVALAGYWSGGTAPNAYSTTGTLPTGWSVNSSTGVLTRGAATAGSFSFTVTATDAASATATSNSIAVTIAAALAISVQPSNQSAAVGATATFSVTVTGGTAPITYQWRRNGSNISGATSSSYTTPATTVSGGSANNGDLYSVVIADAASATVTSSNATLTVVSYAISAGPFALNTGSGPQLSVAVAYTLWAGVDTGAVSGTPINGTGTTHATTGVLAVSGLSASGSYLISVKRTDGTGRWENLVTAA